MDTRVLNISVSIQKSRFLTKLANNQNRLRLNQIPMVFRRHVKNVERNKSYPAPGDKRKTKKNVKHIKNVLLAVLTTENQINLKSSTH